MDKLKMHSLDGVARNIELIGNLFPGAVTEVMRDGKVERAIDFDVLRQELSDCIVEGREERYQFTWPDKKKAMLAANAPITATLRPVVADSVGRDGTPGGFDSENLYIEGDNLEVLKLLQETYLGKVKMIYIDPPYNTGNNLIYKNNYHQSTSEYLNDSGQFDDSGNSLVSNPETSGRFHTNWLNMIYPRLKLAKALLADDGVLCCAIDENEQASLMLILKELFGEGGYEHVCVSVVHNPGGTQGGNFSYTHEYAIFVFPKSKERMIQLQDRTDTPDIRPLRDVSKGNNMRTDAKNCFYPILVKNNQIVGFGDVCDDSFHPESANIIRSDGIIEIYPIDASGNERKWVWARQTVESILSELRVVYNKKRNILDIERVKTHFNYKTVWTDDIYNANSYGTKLLSKLMPNCGFSFPKSLFTVLECVRAVTLNDKNAIILDFFSGSATTPHAVIQLNSEDSGKRRFIAVQVPEDLDVSLQNATGEARKSIQQSINFLDALSVPHKLSEIGKERIRRAGRKIKEESPLTTQDLDIGFRCLRLDTSNMQQVYYTPDEVTQTDLFSLVDNVKPDRTPEDLLFQVMLDLGVLLSSPIAVKEIAGKKVFNVADGFLLACFDHDVTDETVKAIAQMKPYYAVFRDSSMANDSVATNFDQIFETYSPDTVRKVL